MTDATPDSRTIEEIVEAKVAHIAAVNERKRGLVREIYESLMASGADHLTVTDIGGDPHTLGVETKEGFTFFVSVENA